jgi:hypothetical protein
MKPAEPNAHVLPQSVNAGIGVREFSWPKIRLRMSEDVCTADFCVETCLAALQTGFVTKMLFQVASVKLHQP